MAQQTFEEIAAAVKQAESGGKRYKSDGKTLTTSAKGALGEMQVMPKTIKDPGFGVEPARDKSPDEIARVGRDYLQAMLNKYGDMDKALVAYNMGPGSTDKWIAAGEKMERLPEETRTYIQRVKGFLGAKDVSRETAPVPVAKPREPLPPSLPPMAAAPKAAPALNMKEQVAALGPGYQAALALSFLSDTDEPEGDTTATQEFMAKRQEERDAAEEAAVLQAQVARPSAFAEFADFKIRSPFPAVASAPVRMAGGGEAVKEQRFPEKFYPLSKDRSSKLMLKNILERTRQEVLDRYSPFSVQGRTIDLAYKAYKSATGTQPLEDLLEQAQRANRGADIIGGAEPGSMKPVERAEGGQVELPMYDPEGNRYVIGSGNQVKLPMYDPEGNQYGGGGGNPVTNPFSDLTQAQQAAYYAANPTMAGITQLGQKAFGLTSLGMLQNALVPGFVSEQGLIAMGINPAAYQGAKESFRGSEIADMNAEAAAAQAANNVAAGLAAAQDAQDAAQGSISDQSSAGASDAGTGYGTGDSSGGFGEGQYNRGGLVRRANGSPEEGEQAASDSKEDQLLAMVDQMPAPAARVVLQDLAQGPRAIVSPRVMESLAKRAAMQMGSARQQMFALSRQPRYSVEGGGTGQAASLYGSADIPVGDVSSLRLGAGGYRVDVPGYKESGLTSTDIGFRTPFMGGNFSAGVSRDMQRGVNAGRVGYARKFDNGGEVDKQGEREAAERQAASRPAFITPSSGRGRKEGNISKALASGEGYVEFAKGLTNIPQNLVGAPMDISNMIAQAFGGGSDKPIGGSEYIKEALRKRGLGFTPSTDPTLAGFYAAGDLGSNLVNPAGATRAGVKAAGKTGEAARMLAQDFQQYNQQLSVPGASYAVRQRGVPVAIAPRSRETTDDFLKSMTDDTYIAFKEKNPDVPIYNYSEVQATKEFDKFSPPIDEAQVLADNLALTPDQPLNNWFSKALPSYLRTDFATTKDQLVMAADGDKLLHLAPRNFSDSADDQNLKAFLERKQRQVKQTRGAEAREAEKRGENPLGSVAKTEYGQRIEDLTDLSASMDPIDVFSANRVPPSMRSLVQTAPETRVTDFDTNIVDILKLDKLRDKMLEIRALGPRAEYSAYSQPPAKVPDEFLLPNDTLAKLNVAGASNRVARYTRWEDETRQGMATTALREDPGLTRLQLQDGKFIGVTLPDVKKDPSYMKLVTDVGCDGGWCTRYGQNAEDYASGDSQLHVIVTGQGKQARPTAQFAVETRMFRGLDNGVPYEIPKVFITESRTKGNTTDFEDVLDRDELRAVQEYVQKLDSAYGGLGYVDKLDELSMEQLPFSTPAKFNLIPYDPVKINFSNIRKEAIRLNNNSQYLIDGKDRIFKEGRVRPGEDLFGPTTKTEDLLNKAITNLKISPDPLQRATGGMVERQSADNRRYM